MLFLFEKFKMEDYIAIFKLRYYIKYEKYKTKYKTKY